jgi:hypothetical protein
VILLVLAAALAGVIQWINAPRRFEAVEPGPPPPRLGTRAKGEEGCPCGCDHSEAMAAELRAGEAETAFDAIEKTLGIIAAREDAGYITEAMVEHRLRLLALRGDLGRAPGATDRGIPTPKDHPRLSAMTAVVEDGRLRARAELTAHGEATEIVRGKEKQLRSSFRLGIEIENVSGATLTLPEPSLEGPVPLPVSRWYVVGSDGRPWDGVIEAGAKILVNVIGYLGEPVQPGTTIDATARLDSLVLHASTRARRHWNREE